ncbi:hypothetical protein LTR66_003764 [Elasticomyces elasticus]|nr:hypothetical protein LTR66_003764 [Elasticomyces elasticus]
MPSSLLSTHLDQISLCSASISSLPFPGPKIFTNALLAPHDITALIRDTEAQERALFSVAVPPNGNTAKAFDFGASTSTVSGNAPSRRATTFAGMAASRAPRRHTAVAAVLGGDLFQRTRRGAGDTSSGRRDGVGREKGEVDVEVLLEGAEKLCGVYPVPGALDKINTMRQRHAQLTANIAHYEARVGRQTAELERMHRKSGYGDEEEDDGAETAKSNDVPDGAITMTAEDTRREEEEIRELERKRKSLEERVKGMESDLGGLMR